MTPKTTTITPELHDYLIEHGSSPPDDVQTDLIAETRSLGDQHVMQISPDQGAFMSILARALGVRRAIEVGTFTGYSALCVARALPADGNLICCDVSEEWTSIARKYWDRAGVADRIDLRLGPALDTLRALPAEPTFELAFLDADKETYIEYWDELVPRMRPGGVLLVDNVLSSGRIIDPAYADTPRYQAITAFNDHVRDDPRVEAAILTIADGLTFARKT